MITVSEYGEYVLEYGVWCNENRYTDLIQTRHFLYKCFFVCVQSKEFSTWCFGYMKNFIQTHTVSARKEEEVKTQFWKRKTICLLIISRCIRTIIYFITRIKKNSIIWDEWHAVHFRSQKDFQLKHSSLYVKSLLLYFMLYDRSVWSFCLRHDFLDCRTVVSFCIQSKMSWINTYMYSQTPLIQ